MKNPFPPLLLSIAFLPLTGCTDSPPTADATNRLMQSTAQPATLRGLYQQTAQGRFLTDCAEMARAAGGHMRATPVLDQTGRLDSLYRAATQPAPIPEESVYAVLHGSLSEGTLTVTRIDTLQGKNMLSTCPPYDFWCSGTEPFWSLQISAAEGGIFLKNMADERGSAYVWSAPTTDGKNSWVYRAAPKNAADASAPIQVTVRRQPCSDGMSDLRFDYTSEVKIGATVLRGCAVRYGERMPREEAGQ
ncbi:MAG TPA: hypothetical protein PKD78_16390 [Saprospiraceae bacterium]|nr:hypothetical protein [Saprospiraceae bacterium]HNG90660.1 hypothetical protein [Saprospiraceae bacterium]